MSQQLRVLDSILEDPGSSPSTHVSSSNPSVSPVPGDMMTLITTMSIKNVHCSQTYMQTKDSQI